MKTTAPIPPNYTQVPNDLLGNILQGNNFEAGTMAKLSGSELKLYLAVCRITFGYHQEQRRASVEDMITLTGLSRQGIYNAAKELVKLGLIEMKKDGGVTLWQATVKNIDNELCEDDVNKLDASVKKVDNDVKKFDTHLRKKPKKKPKKKIKEGGTPQPAAQKITDHPALQAYKNEFQRWPRKNVYQDIINTVGDEPEHIEFWQQVCNAWKLSPYSPTNYAGMMDCFTKRKIPGTSKNGSHQSGARRHQAKYAVNTVSSGPTGLGEYTAEEKAYFAKLEAELDQNHPKPGR